jgi:succinyl-CoA:acetate CoA-transferase
MALTSATTTRVLNSILEHKIMTAEEAAALIGSGDQIGMSGFTGSGYPKTVPVQLARRIADAHFRGEKFQVSVFTSLSWHNRYLRTGQMKPREEN